MLGNIVGYVYKIILGLDLKLELGSLDGSFDDSNDGNIE